MNFDLSPDERRLADVARTLELPLHISTREAARLLGEAGLLQPQASQAGHTPLSLALLLEEISARSPTAGVVAWTTTALFLDPLARFARLEESARAGDTHGALEAVLAGRAIGASTGSVRGPDANDARRVVAARAGDGLTLRGEQRFVLLGDEADHVLVIAADEEGDGATACLVHRGAEGVLFADVTDRSATLVLEGARVDHGSIVGAHGAAGPIAARVASMGAIAVAAHAVGVARGALEKATARLRERRATATGDLQLATFAIADMATELDAARLLVHRAALALAHDPSSASRAVSVAELFATETAVQITLRAARLFAREAASATSELETYHQAARFAELDGTSGERLRPRIAVALGNHPSP